MQDARGSLLCIIMISMRVTEVVSLQGGTVAYVQLCRALDYQDVGSNAMVPTPGGVNIGPIDSRMQQTPFMQGLTSRHRASPSLAAYSTSPSAHTGEQPASY
jgi:hypothetical protein